jgi:membrane-bound metal-dependent hydrolase YbcI (DUF457 family)
LFAVGHLALGYLLGRGSAKLLAKKVSVPLILALSIIPDTDILFRQFIEHRGPTHSIVVLFIVFLPIFAIYRKEAIPYFLAVVSHPLIGDFLVGGSIKLLWPLSMQYFGLGVPMAGPIDIVLEWSTFLVSIVVMLKINDIGKLFQPHLANLLLSIPVFTLLLPTILSFPLGVPVWLEPPHLAFMLLLAAAVIVTLVKLFKIVFRSRIACKQDDP